MCGYICLKNYIMFISYFFLFLLMHCTVGIWITDLIHSLLLFWALFIVKIYGEHWSPHLDLILPYIMAFRFWNKSINNKLLKGSNKKVCEHTPSSSKMIHLKLRVPVPLLNRPKLSYGFPTTFFPNWLGHASKRQLF